VKQLVALLRGINVGATGKGRKAVPMAELRALAEDLGWKNAQTYIQSGNLVFDASTAAATAEQKLTAAIADHFGFDVPVIVRPLEDLVRAEGECPFAAAADERPNLVHIGFAKEKVVKSAVAACIDYCTNGERVAVKGQFIWSDCPNGVGRSKLTPAVLDRAFGSPVTMRNVKTLRALAAIAR